MLIACFWVCCLGVLHEIKNESIMAERAFLEARGQLRAEEAKEQREQEKKERVIGKEEEEEMAMPLPQSHNVTQGEMQGD